MISDTSQVDPFNTKRPEVHELRGWKKGVFLPASAGMHLYYATWKLGISDKDLDFIQSIRPPYVLVSWHNRSLSVPPVLKKYIPPNTIDCLISASKAAAWEVAFFEKFGIRSIRGSTTRRSIQALREMVRSLDNERIVLLSPDGPSGPLYSIQPGAIALARKKKVPIVYFCTNASAAYHMHSWDHHLVPLPFSTVTTKFGMIGAEDIIWRGTDAEVAAKLRRDLLEFTEDPSNPIRNGKE